MAILDLLEQEMVRKGSQGGGGKIIWIDTKSIGHRGGGGLETEDW